MITLYYCSDPGMLIKHQNRFLQQYPDAVIFTPNSYAELFNQFENSLFFAPKAYCINDAVLLGNNWIKWAKKGAKFSSNIAQINNWTGLLTHLSQQGIAIFITVYEDQLLNHPAVEKLLKLTSNQDHHVKKLNLYNKKQYLDQLINDHKLQLDRSAQIYLYELFPNNAHRINEIFDQIRLLGEKKLNLSQLQQIIGVSNKTNFYQIIDAWLLGEDRQWLSLFDQNCHYHEQAEELWNILLYKFSEFYHYWKLRINGQKPSNIMQLMNKEAFMIQIYEKALYRNRKLLSKINYYLLKLVEHSKKFRRNIMITPQILKLILIIV